MLCASAEAVRFNPRDCSTRQAPVSRRDPASDSCTVHISFQASCFLHHPIHSPIHPQPTKNNKKKKQEKMVYENDSPCPMISFWNLLIVSRHAVKVIFIFFWSRLRHHVTRIDQSSSALQTPQLWTNIKNRLKKNYHWKWPMYGGMLLLDHPLLKESNCPILCMIFSLMKHELYSLHPVEGVKGAVAI